MSAGTERNDISSEPSPGPEENDNLGAEDGKGNPPTVVPSGQKDADDVAAEDPDSES